MQAHRALLIWRRAMTVSTVVDHNDYTGNGVTTLFPYTFRIFTKSDLTVTVIDLNENISVLVLDTDYVVTNAGGYNGGNVVLSAALNNGWKISIARELEPTQETDLRNQGKFFAEVHEDAFDKLTMLIQQVGSMFRLALRKPSSISSWYDALNNYIRNVKDPRDPQDAATKNYTDTELGRTLRVPEQINQLPAAADRANKMPAFDSLGNAMVVVPPSGSASDVLIELAKPTGAGLSGFSSALTYATGTVGYWLNKALTNTQKNIVFATADAGIPNDGSDVSAQVSTFLNANKGKFIVFDSGTYQFANVVLSGSGWKGTSIYFKGKHLMKPCTGNLDNTPGFPFYGGIILTKDVDGLTLHYEGDGNRALQFERQHIFNVAIWGAINVTIPYFNVVEFMGDGLYINSSDQTSSTAQNAGNINIGLIKGINSTVGGRNLISIVSCIRGGIDTLLAENIGGVIQGEQQPGGIDFEPNDLPGCVITDFVVKQATVIGAGNIQMVSPVAASPKKIRNCHILSASLRNSNQSFRLYGTTFSSIKGDATTVTANAGMIEGCDNSTLDIKANACETIILAGSISPNSNCVIKAHGVNVRNAGIITAGGVRCDYDLFVDNFFAGGSGNYIGLWFRDINSIGGMEQRDCRYRLRLARGALGAYAIQYAATPSPITFTGDNKIQSDSVFNGWPDFLHVTGNAGQYLNIEGKIKGLTVSNGVPPDGVWKQGAFVYYSNPSPTNKFLGYYRMTTGGNNVAGTDWGTVPFV